MSDYRIKLDIFSGPMDLLLYLVRKDEVDIYDIPIARVTDQYLHYIEVLQTLDIDLAGDFLVMAATLMQIKSAMLLPRTEVEDAQPEDLQDPRKELIRQLLEYKKFKDAANFLDAASENRQLRHSRPNTILQKIKPDTEPQLDMDQVSVWDLLEAFDNILKATGNYADYSHIEDETPIDLYQIDILDRLQKQGPMSFESIFKGSKNRLVLIGRFLAILELVRGDLIRVDQPENSDSLFLKAATDKDPELAVQQVFYANIDFEPEPPQTHQDNHTDQTSDAQDSPQQSAAPAIPIVELPPNKPKKPAQTPASDDSARTPIPIVELPAQTSPGVPVEESQQYRD